jgi:hypothetical protein
MPVSTPTSTDRISRRFRPAAALLAALGLVLAGCAAPPERRSDVPNYGEVKVLFELGQDVQVINVRSLDRLPITSAVLVLPDGDRVPAYSIDQIANPSFSNRLTLGGPSNDVTGIGAGAPMLAGPGMQAQTTRLIGQIASVGLIRVPDMGSYRQDWQSAKVEVHLGLAPDDRVELLPAPKPE